MEDVNGDGVVDFADVLLVLAAWGPSEGAAPPGDTNGLDDVHAHAPEEPEVEEDALIVLSEWT